jgi:hypothetical protein
MSVWRGRMESAGSPGGFRWWCAVVPFVADSPWSWGFRVRCGDEVVSRRSGESSRERVRVGGTHPPPHSASGAPTGVPGLSPGGVFPNECGRSGAAVKTAPWDLSQENFADGPPRRQAGRA